MLTLRFADACPTLNAVRALPVLEGQGEAAAARAGDHAELVRAAIAAGRFKGESGQLVDVALPGGARLALLGLGKAETLGEATLNAAGAALTARFLTSGAVSLCLDGTGRDGAVTDDHLAHVANGARLRSWRWDKYRTTQKDKDKSSLTELVLVGADGARATAARLTAVADGVALARELVTEPANVIYPESFVERVRPIAELGVEIEVLDEAQMRELGMGALISVTLGSEKEARLLILRWNGGAAGDKPVVFVGKGVTFDSGGISIKPGGGMEDMKWDMGGAAAVAGAMKAIAGRKAKANVVGICGLVENMPDGKATRPGDVVTSMSGQTIEVINTDAEGRLVLCDALHYAQERFEPEVIVDLATLTGAMLIALGHEQAGVFSNDDDLAARLIAAGAASGDKLWRLPLGAAYDKLIDSPIADMKNVGGRAAGSITAAQFLQRFIKDRRQVGAPGRRRHGVGRERGRHLGQGGHRLRRAPARPLRGGRVRGLMRVDFYQLERDRADTVVPMLAAKALGAGARLSVVCGDERARSELSEALWRHAPDSFLAHGEVGGSVDARQPILLGKEPTRANGATLLLVADGRWREVESFDRLLFLFRPDEVGVARQRWKALDEDDRHYWAQGEDGRWVERG